MDRTLHFVFRGVLFVAATASATLVLADPAASGAGNFAPEMLSRAVAKIIADEIPREYERKKDWGQTAEITTGVRSSGNFFKFDIHRQHSEVNDGVWKHYRLSLVDPDKNLHVEIANLRTLEFGRVALTLNVAAKVHGWARIKTYERGIHLISLEAEGDTNARLSLDAEIGVETVKTDSLLPTYRVDPVVTAARLKFDDFKLSRISNVRGALAHEVGIMMREAVEDELKGPKLAEKINKSIAKKRDRLQFSAEDLLSRKPSTLKAKS